MAKADIEEVLAVDQTAMANAIKNYESYPEFITGCSGVTVQPGAGEGGATRAIYQMNLMKEITYTLDHYDESDSGVIRWNLVESDFLKKNEGRWTLKSEGDGKTRVRYEIDIEFKFPVPGFVMKKLIKGSLPGMLKEFQKRAG